MCILGTAALFAIVSDCLFRPLLHSGYRAFKSRSAAESTFAVVMRLLVGAHSRLSAYAFCITTVSSTCAVNSPTLTGQRPLRLSLPALSDCMLQGIFTPSKIDGGHVIAYENGLSNTTGDLLVTFNRTLLSFEDASQAGVLTTLSPTTWQELNKTVASMARVNNRTASTRGNTAGKCCFAVKLLAACAVHPTQHGS